MARRSRNRNGNQGQGQEERDGNLADEVSEASSRDGSGEGEEKEEEVEGDDLVVSFEDGPRLFDESGLTDQERRKIRKKQRTLLKEIEEADDVDIDDARNRNNVLYCKVRYTREAVLDGENLDVIAKKTTRKIDRMVQVPRYDAERLIAKMAGRYNADGGFDWESFGSDAKVCFNMVPTNVSFLNGPLMDGFERAVRERKAPVRRKVEEESAAEQRPQNVDQSTTVKDVDQLSAIESSMRVLQKTLKKRVNDNYRSQKEKILSISGQEKLSPDLSKKLKKHGVGVDAIQYLFNPNSFTQTVENIFHFSFLVKKGSAAIGVREAKKLKVTGEDGTEHEVEVSPPGPYVKYVDDESVSMPPARQAIVTLTMKDWRELCRVYKVTKGDLPHRTGSKFAAAPRSPKRRRTS